MIPLWLQAARLRACNLRPYFAHALWSLLPVERQIHTLAVDKNWRLYYDPTVDKIWTVEEIAWVLIHEINHLLRNHAERALPNTEIWKVATDLEINSSMKREKAQLPLNALYPDKYGLQEGLLAEAYYHLLLGEETVMIEISSAKLYDRDNSGSDAGQGSGHESMQSEAKSSGLMQTAAEVSSDSEAMQHSHHKRAQNEAKGESAKQEGVEGGSSNDAQRSYRAAPAAGECGSCATGVYEPWEIKDEGALLKVQGDLIRARVARDIVEAKGDIPGEWERWARNQLHPQVDWRQALRSYIFRAANMIMGKNDYTYQRPSRRQSVMGDVILPSTCSHTPKTVIIMDTSGSMSSAQLDQALTEVNNILKTLRILEKVTVLAVDAEVRAVYKVSRAMHSQLLPGGGGTKMEVGIAQAMKYKPELVIVLTDGLTDWPKHSPGVPVVICLIGHKDHWNWQYPLPDWAKVVEIKDMAPN